MHAKCGMGAMNGTLENYKNIQLESGTNINRFEKIYYAIRTLQYV